MSSNDPAPGDSTVNFFTLVESLNPILRRRIEDACTSMKMGAGEFIYQQGDPADAVFFVVWGVVEAVTFSPDGKLSRCVAQMSTGEFFGDLAVFTDNPRFAAVRTREPSEVLRIEKSAFMNLLKTVPDLGLFFSRNLARRLHSTSTEAHLSVYAIDLTGNLQRFDLLTIVQAITGMGHTGELHLNNSANQLLGSFFFRQGRVEHARFGHLFGLEAIWQGFIESTSEGTFNFKSVEAPTTPFPQENKIDMESTSLLLEGVGKRDTFQGMPETLRHMDGRLARLAPELDWKNPDTQVVAKEIWGLIVEPQPLLTIWKKLNYSAITVLEVVMEMGMNSQAELFIDETQLRE